MRTALRIALASACLFSLAARADEGMWTFDNIPSAKIQAKYGFTPSRQWLDHVRLSSIRLNDGGSGSFISATGLLLTNHHVARGQLQKNSTAQHDYIKNGFYARTQAEELKSPDLEINILQKFQNITARVQGAARPGMSDVDALKARNAETALISKEAKASTGLEPEIVSLYQGGEYWLYLYKKYTDVRIVFAPEQQTAFFGGDPDNFTYPRYDMDMAIFRVYENGKPIHTENFLRWNSKGAAEHELTFVSGHPGSTQRDQTFDQLKLDAEVANPAVLETLRQRLAVLKQYAARSPEQARQTASDIFNLENARKVYEGRVVALNDKAIVAKKQAEEDDFRARVNANPSLEQQYGSSWSEMAAIDAAQAPLIKQNIYRTTNSLLLAFASRLVNYSIETKKPDAERINGYHDAQLEGVRFRLASTAPLYPDYELAKMTAALVAAQQVLPTGDPWLKIVLAGRTPQEAAAYYISGTKLTDPAFRKQLLEGGATAVEASTDPIVQLARKLDPINRELTATLAKTINGPLARVSEKLGKARFAAYGKDRYPDATFTLRLSYGSVEGSPENGTITPPHTTLYGLYDRSDSFGGRVPFDLPQRWLDARTRLDLATPLDFVTTNDITGGNSGSPIINKQGELVGLVFDGNIESIAGDFVYEMTHNRTVAVHTAVMMEAMRKLYNAAPLADEIEAR